MRKIPAAEENHMNRTEGETNMNDLIEILLQKQQELIDIIEHMTLATKNAPKGFLRIAHKNNAIQYYHKSEENSLLHKSGKYIRKENRKLAYDLAQRDYNLSVLKIARKQLNLVQQFLANYQPYELEEIYGKMNSSRKAIVEPMIIADEEFANRWSDEEYQGKSFAEGVAEIYTSKGERVRSKSEKIIADMLFYVGIPYRYECPLVLRGMGTVYPDFTVLNIKQRKEIYWEYLGMTDNVEYCEKALRKIEFYVKNGIIPGDQLIITHETSKRPLETVVIEKTIQIKF